MMSTHSGSVVSFSVEAGSGHILDDKTSREVFFHATQLADGTRKISLGTPVEFDVVPGGRGRYEAVRVRVVANNIDSPKPDAFRCPVCGAEVDGEPRAYEICDVCGWEDDPVQYDDPSSLGANAESLNNARITWKRSERSS
jgi:cold shock CspA family protein